MRAAFAVGIAEVAGVLLKGNRCIERTSVERIEGSSLATTIKEVLQQLRKRGRVPRKVIVALSPSIVQTKELPGLTSAAAASDLALIVQRHHGRFFVGDIEEPITAITVNDAVWGAAAPASAIREVAAAFRESGLVPHRFVTSVESIARAGAQTVQWREGRERHAVASRRAMLSGLRRIRAHEGQDSEPDVEEQPHVWAAECAARNGAECQLVLPEQSDRRPWWRGTSKRERLAVAAMLLSLAVQPVIPGLKEGVATLSTWRAILSAPDAYRRAARDWSVLESANRVLGIAPRFNKGGAQVVGVLSMLTRAVPMDVVVRSIAIDSSEVLVTVEGRNALALVSELERLAPHLRPEVTGTTVGEAEGLAEVTRVSVRLRAVRGSATTRRGS